MTYGVTGADEEETKTWANVSERIKLAFEGLLKGDFAVFNAAAGEDSQGFRNAVIDELRSLGKGKGSIKRIKVSGTSLGGFPAKSLATILQLEYENSATLSYKVQSLNGNILGTSDKAPPLSVMTPIQAKSDELFVGWNLLTEKGFQITIERAQDRTIGITIYRDNQQWPARRVS